MMQTSNKPVIENAPAKVNLFLHIAGRRPDGFHELESLASFAVDVCDRLIVHQSVPTRAAQNASTHVSISGPFASKISGNNNLVVAALEQLAVQSDQLIAIDTVEIEKNLPVAAGVGGGSADAAAILRAVKTLQPHLVDKINWHALEVGLGADVPVCMTSQASWMTGLGDRVTRLCKFPTLAAVLVNPQSSVPENKTAQVFKTLNAPDVLKDAVSPTVPEIELDFSSPQALIAGLATLRNDLEPPACAVMPSAGHVLNSLRQTPGCQLARLSGAGPTGFGLFSTLEAARIAENELQMAHPGWWVAATQLA